MNANKDSCPLRLDAERVVEKPGDCMSVPAGEGKPQCNDMKIGELYVRPQNQKKSLSTILHEMRENLRMQDTTCRRKETR